MAIDSIPARFMAQAAQNPNQPAYHFKRGDVWQARTWGQYVAEVRTAAKAMMALGLEPGGTVSILGFNRPEWVIFDLACMCAGGAPAGIYTTCSPPEVQYIIEHAESAIVLLEDEAQWEKVKAQRENLPGLKHVVMMKDAPAIDDPLVMSWEAFNQRAMGVSDADLDARVEGIKADQLATFIYTSGTTGPPKGVMLSHHNLAWTAGLCRELVSMTSDDVSLSYLPLSHIAEQMFTIHAPCTAGSQVYFAESIPKVPDNLKEVRPTVLFAVPRIWEKFYAGIRAKMAEASGVKAAIAGWAMGVGARHSAAKNRGEAGGGFRYALANRVVFSKLKLALGLDRARICVSGAAPISREILEFFASLDLVVLEVYGQSEDCGPTTFNLPGRTRYGSVGPAIPGVEVKIADDGEILVKGPNVFMGYYKDQAATDATLIDGWLHSGDLGAFDQDGFLTITGRKKDIIITAGGKNIAPKNIEAALKNLPLISEAVVIGDRRKYLSVLITLDEEAVERFASAQGLGDRQRHEDPTIKAEVQAGIDEVNKLFARVEQLKKFHILQRQLSVDEGELTPTLKVKRRIVYEHFADEIEAMYADA